MKLRDIKNERERLRTQNAEQLVDEIEDLRREAFNLRFQRATGQLENTARVKEVRRSVARIQTMLGEKKRSKAPAEKKKG